MIVLDLFMRLLMIFGTIYVVVNMTRDIRDLIKGDDE